MAERARPSAGGGLKGTLKGLGAITHFLSLVPPKTRLVARQAGQGNPVEGIDGEDPSCRERAVGEILAALTAIERQLARIIGK